MGERKVVNKYYPPDFDPKKIPRIRKPKNQQTKIRTMVPYRIRCNTCGNYISEGTKVNSRKEEVIGGHYLGIRVYRFYLKCTNCCAELILKTDPRKSSYVVESGATRCYDDHHEEEAEKQVEESGDKMTSLEKRALVSKRETAVMDAISELKSMKSRRMSVSVDSMLGALSRREEEEVAKEEEAVLIKSIRFGEQRRIAEEETDEKMRRMEPMDDKKPKTKRLACGKSPIQSTSVRIITKKKKTSVGLASLCHNYDGIDEED